MLILIATLVVFCAEKFMAAVMIVIVTTVVMKDGPSHPSGAVHWVQKMYTISAKAQNTIKPPIII